jgi:hypothetical protein
MNVRDQSCYYVHSRTTVRISRELVRDYCLRRDQPALLGASIRQQVRVFAWKCESSGPTFWGATWA